MSRGEFGAVAAPRLLKLFADEDIPTTWYIPGITVDTYESICRDIHGAGHEIGHHGYDHISPAGLEREAELDQLKRGAGAIERIIGKRPRGYRSPAWDFESRGARVRACQTFVH